MEESSASSEKIEEPSPKKQKRTDFLPEKLEHRLSNILCCTVCLDLPKTSIYQCNNGHLMCAGCFTHLFADAQMKSEDALCPRCSILMKKDYCSRNLAVEKALLEWPEECKFCAKKIPRFELKQHEEELCEERIVSCCYSCIGCQWSGPYHVKGFHENICTYPVKRGADILDTIDKFDKQRKEDILHSFHMYELLSLENISINDLQFKPIRSDDVLQKLCFETSSFMAFKHKWVVRACLNENQRDPTQSCERSLTYQLVLETKCNSVLGVQFLVLKGPFGDMQVRPQLYHYGFSEDDTISSSSLLPLCDSAECNRLLAAKIINFRLIMFQMTKL